jgi:hypothetical protein
MGFMDKVKQTAGQAMTKAQQGVSQGKAKLDEVQAKRQWDALLRNLGAAYYAQERQNGPADAVGTAMAALDEHASAHGAGSTSAEELGTPSGGDGGGPQPAAAPSSGGAAPTSGDFNIDDM